LTNLRRSLLAILTALALGALAACTPVTDASPSATAPIEAPTEMPSESAIPSATP
jgi:hypothetical protein